MADRRSKQHGIHLRHSYPVVAAFIVAALVVCYGTSGQSRTTGRPRPSLELEGTGALVPTSQSCSPDGICPGTLTATLTGPPLRSASLNMSVGVNQTASPDSCYIANGTAELGSITNSSDLNFTGELCVGGAGFTYVLKGTLTSIPHNNCQSVPLTVFAGELTVFGEAHTIGAVPPGGNPIPLNQLGGHPGAIVSIIGATGQIPDPCPSP